MEIIIGAMDVVHAAQNFEKRFERCRILELNPDANAISRTANFFRT